MNVSLNNVSLRYKAHTALDEVTCELSSEKIYGLLGRNGAGKTSLLSILASYREPSTGTITINGEKPFENPHIMQQVSLVYNKDYSDESDTVKAMLEGVERYRPNYDKNYAEYLISQFKLDVTKPIKTFSKGMQSALNAVIGLSSRTPITIFDEVYVNMDAPSRDIFYKELLKDQEQHPRLIIMSTHLVSEMDYLFDDVILLDKGKLVLQEDYTSLMAKGATIIGHANDVDEIVQSKKQINVQHLGRTKSVSIFGELNDQERQTALAKGLEIAPLSLQDLFIHLTKEVNEDETDEDLS
ncbi:ABC transporter ATP-binding protein [Salipaludibacillus sp. LMS25]|jgi:ABC-2 type transport system ATP-binding protein|uniref:ATP-binding cassette domain-containing protein n=1 Tax=Salipaludibacillus sp. LMS25 TaxID=2924031 RepID=UPI0020D1BF75|nr:ABC transporter ATP-binding protein [Salipaludibacillus sp. LMS25]UTR13561.1 ABC transporter ATP-binding protein [Salipaludibacillus sp. LMS25]